MADFCNICADELWRDNFPPDIDVPKIFHELENGTFIPVMCEGCALNAVGKNEQGELILSFVGTDESQIEFEVRNLDDYQVFKNERINLNEILCQK